MRHIILAFMALLSWTYAQDRTPPPVGPEAMAEVRAHQKGLEKLVAAPVLPETAHEEIATLVAKLKWTKKGSVYTSHVPSGSKPGWTIAIETQPFVLRVTNNADKRNFVDFNLDRTLDETKTPTYHHKAAKAAWAQTPYEATLKEIIAMLPYVASK